MSAEKVTLSAEKGDHECREGCAERSVAMSAAEKVTMSAKKGDHECREGDPECREG